MKKREFRVECRLNAAELYELNRRVAQTDLSREAYLRKLIQGIRPMERIPLDYKKFSVDLHRIGNNLNQLTRLSHQVRGIDADQLKETLEALGACIERITEEWGRTGEAYGDYEDLARE